MSQTLKTAADELAAIIGLQDNKQGAYLAAKLSDLRYDSDTYRSFNAAGPPSDRADAAYSVESACNRILSAFAITDRDFDLESALDTSPTAAILAFQIAQIVRPDRYYHSSLVDKESRDRITAILDGIVILRDAARRTGERAEQEKGGGMGGARRVEDWSRKETAWHILRLYIELTGQPPGISSPPGGGQKGGPAVRFLDATLRWLGFPVKRSTAANLINQLKDDPALLQTKQLTKFKSEDS